MTTSLMMVPSLQPVSDASVCGSPCTAQVGVEEPVILFSQESYGSGRYINRFSVESKGSTQVSTRAIVTHEGTDVGDGLWTCTKDGGGRCAHVSAASKHIQILLQNETDPMHIAVESIGGSLSNTCVAVAECMG